MAAHLTAMDVASTGIGDEDDAWDMGAGSVVYQLYPHAKLLSAKFRDAALGRSRRQIWALPPRYGKSILASQWGPAWFLEMFPHKRVILASYGHDLALHNARQCRNILRNYRHRLSTQLQKDANAADQWLTDKGGGLKAAGVGGALTGFGADLAIVDDPLKDWEEAQSANQREKVWDWYRSVLRTRLHKGGSIIVLATRWHLDDLSGRLLAEDAKREEEGKPRIWDYIRLPTIADGDERGEPDALGREDGDVLCDDLFPALEVMEQREELGDLIFSAMHQQAPTLPGGSVFRREWLIRYDYPPEPQELWSYSMSCDLAFKDSSTSDFVVLQVWARGPDNAHYVIDQRRGKWTYTQTKDEILGLLVKHSHITRVLVEDTANGPAVISDMARGIPGMVPIRPKSSKYSRANAVTSMMRSGHVRIPTNALLRAQGGEMWADDLVNELCAFTGRDDLHDDQVDALTQYLSNTEDGPFGLGRGFYPWSSNIR